MLLPAKRTAPHLSLSMHVEYNSTENNLLYTSLNRSTLLGAMLPFLFSFNCGEKDQFDTEELVRRHWHPSCDQTTESQ